MGGGSYSYQAASDRSHNLRASNASRESIFRQRSLSSDMNIRGKVRESCDSDEHPTSFPIIIALDVTGSMGQVPENLIKEAFPLVMKSLQEHGIDHAQVCFMGIGDHYSDNAPIQVGQFETSDELTEKWLKDIFIEGGGGGNNGESYLLAWYTAAFHTKIDSFLKRKKKGVLITIGDEPCHKLVDARTIKELFGTGEKDMTASDLFRAASEQWDVYHININTWSSKEYRSQNKWRELIGSHLVSAESMESKEISHIISSIVVKSYQCQTELEEILESEETPAVEQPKVKHEL